MIFSTLLRLHNSAVYLNDLWSINDRLTAGGGDLSKNSFQMNETSGPEAMGNAKCRELGKMWVEESYKIRLS